MAPKIWTTLVGMSLAATVMGCNSVAGFMVNDNTGHATSSSGAVFSAAGDAASAGNATPASSPGPAAGTSTGATTSTPIDFGPNVLVFDANMSMASIQKQMDAIYQKQASNQFGSERYAYLFMPGAYALDVQIGFYMTAWGLGTSPDDTTITGAVRSKATWDGGNATLNFWRGAENLAVVPTQDGDVDVWAVSQATTLRRMHIKGKLALSDGGWSSGGFIADSAVDASINSGTQQQFLTRNSTLTQWSGSNWNMVFVGDKQAPVPSFPSPAYTVVAQTPIVREKPFLVIDSNNAYAVAIPPLKTNSQAHSWAQGAQTLPTLSINHFYIAQSATDTADTLNAALAKGLHLILTPGVYTLTQSLKVTYANTIVMGLGMATLKPTAGTEAMVLADVDGLTISGILFDAGPQNSSTLLEVGPSESRVAHPSNPTALFDLACRVGGAGNAATASCLTINSSDVIVDNVWLWRADHGDGAGWTTNPSATGIIVNGNDVTAYGLFVEHFQNYQTLWNANGGATYFYQSELPYDVPNQAAWTHDGVNGYASYKVAANVATHVAQGLGVYCVFANSVTEDNAIEAPTSTGVNLANMVTEWLGSAQGSAISHVINGLGQAADSSNRQATWAH